MKQNTNVCGKKLLVSLVALDLMLLYFLPDCQQFVLWVGTFLQSPQEAQALPGLLNHVVRPGEIHADVDTKEFECFQSFHLSQTDV